jgi:hypothetical protein
VASGHNESRPSDRAGARSGGFTTQLFGFDATLRYRPLRRAIYKRLLARTELVWSRQQARDRDGGAFGAYVSLDYQFARRWFAGARWDRSDRADDPVSSTRAVAPHHLLAERVQPDPRPVPHTSYGEGIKANEFLFQLLFSIGAHGAHTF